MTTGALVQGVLELASELMKGPICILLNTILMTSHDIMKKNEFGYAFANSSSQTCKIWTLKNDWEALLIYNRDHQNAKQVFNAMILWHKTQNKKMIRYLNTKKWRELYGSWKTKQEMGK